jgi:hypothetical protein
MLATRSPETSSTMSARASWPPWGPPWVIRRCCPNAGEPHAAVGTSRDPRQSEPRPGGAGASPRNAMAWLARRTRGGRAAINSWFDVLGERYCTRVCGVSTSWIPHTRVHGSRSRGGASCPAPAPGNLGSTGVAAVPGDAGAPPPRVCPTRGTASRRQRAQDLHTGLAECRAGSKWALWSRATTPGPLTLSHSATACPVPPARRRGDQPPPPGRSSPP